ncbi:TPA: O-antigen ligase family protein [Streptococcus suis]
MNSKYNVNFIFNEFFGYVIAILLILNCRTVWIHQYAVGNYFNIATSLLLILSSAMYVLTLRKIFIKRLFRWLSVSLFLFFYLLIWIVMTNYNVFWAVISSVSLISILAVVINSDNSQIISLLMKVKRVILLVILISIPFWVMGSFFNIISFTSLTRTNWLGTDSLSYFKSYYGIYFETQSIDFFGVHLVRNSAIFTEGPMAGLVFCIGLAISAFISKKRSIFEILVFATGIFTTFSTNAYIVLLIVFSYFVYFSKNNNRFITVLKYALIPVIFLIIIFITFTLLKSRLNTNSGSIRLDDFSVGFKTWLQQPYFGYGYNNNLVLSQNMGSWRAFNLGFSNSITQVLAQGGIMIFAIYVVPFLKGFSSYIRARKWNYFFFELILLYLFIAISFPYQYILFLLLAFIYYSTTEFKQ